MADAKRDSNYIPTLLAVSNADGITPVVLWADPVTHRLLVDASGGGANTALSNLAAVAINAALLPGVSDSIALGSTTKMWSDIFLGDGAVVNFNNGNVTITHSAGVLTLAGGNLALGTNSLTTTGSVGATGARVTKLWATDIESTNMPTVGGTSLTDTFVNVTGDSMTGLLTISVAGNALRLVNTTDGASSQAASLEGDRATPAANDEAYLSLKLSDSAANQDEFARITWKGTNVTSLSEAGRLQFGVVTAGTLADELYLTGTELAPAVSDGLALGTSALMFADLFLASGAVINFNASNMTITHSAGVLTIGGGTLAMGANSITMTGSLAATGARVTKGWFTDVESTNMPTVGGTAILTSLTAPQFMTIELGHATDTTISRSAAGILAVEGVAIPTISSTDTLSNKTLTAPKFVDLGFIADANGNELIVMDTVAAAVNEIKVANAATGGNPEIAAQGGDANISLQLTPKGTGIVKGELKRFMVRILDSATALTTGTTKGGDFRISNRAITVKAVGAYVDTAATGATLVTIDINEAGVSIISTKITIDASEKSSETAATPPVISDSAIAADAIVTIDIDAIGNTTPGNGLTVWIDYVYA